LGISDLEIRKGKRLFSLFRANLSVLRVIALHPGLRRAFLSGPPFFIFPRVFNMSTRQFSFEPVFQSSIPNPKSAMRRLIYYIEKIHPVG
jgi:hypothetical protein